MVKITTKDIKEMVSSVINKLIVEDAYIDKVNTRSKKANITYTQGSGRQRNLQKDDYLITVIRSAD